jgi:hypothetical protein
LRGDHDEVNLPISVPPYLEIGENPSRNVERLKVSLEASQELALARNIDWLAEEDLDGYVLIHPLPRMTRRLRQS